VTHHVRHKTEAAQVADGRLRRLRLLLAAHDGHERDVDEGKVLLSDAELKLAHGLDEGRALNVAHRAAELDDAHVGLGARLVDGLHGHTLDPVLDRRREVRHNLHRLAEVVAAALEGESQHCREKLPQHGRCRNDMPAQPALCPCRPSLGCAHLPPSR
jgi:hypothetical protein